MMCRRNATVIGFGLMVGLDCCSWWAGLDLDPLLATFDAAVGDFCSCWLFFLVVVAAALQQFCLDALADDPAAVGVSSCLLMPEVRKFLVFEDRGVGCIDAQWCAWAIAVDLWMSIHLFPCFGFLWLACADGGSYSIDARLIWSCCCVFCSDAEAADSTATAITASLGFWELWYRLLLIQTDLWLL
ncbi:hypothetical protein Nepgr_014710 [Nepenthes gracilis]|uniref:Uncharacterized protein n=1 Tax=Nepenthes gracilis TaxID=150966 RepID=A0AAD3XQE0_NEPGR|nr:hypothetical protein Nepgr_014710 [Nepenthes gracilis]